MTNEQFLPTRWITGYPPSRETFAQHLKWVKKEYGLKLAKKCVYQMYWIGIHPLRRKHD